MLAMRLNLEVRRDSLVQLLFKGDWATQMVVLGKCFPIVFMACCPDSGG